jgi:hypothetical protein
MTNHGLVDVTNETEVRRMARELDNARDKLQRYENSLSELRAERTARRLEYLTYLAILLPIIIIGCAFAYFIYSHAQAVV